MILRMLAIASLAACVSEPDRPCSAPRPVAELNATDGTPQYSPWLTSDGTMILWSSRSSGGNNGVFFSTREGVGHPFAPPKELVPNIAGDDCFDATLTPDGTTLNYVCGDGNGGGDVYQSMFMNGTASPPVKVHPELHGILHPSFTDDQLHVYFAVYADGDRDLYTAERAVDGDPFGTWTPLTGLNTSQNQAGPYITPDGSTLYFQTAAYTPDGNDRIYRATLAGGFADPTAFAGLASVAGTYDDTGWVGSDGSIVFESNRSGNIELWTACE